MALTPRIRLDMHISGNALLVAKAACLHELGLQLAMGVAEQLHHVRGRSHAAGGTHPILGLVTGESMIMTMATVGNHGAYRA